MRLRLIRHATLLGEYGLPTLLVDPMLDDPGARPPIQNSPNPRNNPLVPLPFPAHQGGTGVDALLVTHTHCDHWNANASLVLNKQLPLLCQPDDESKFRRKDLLTSDRFLPRLASTTFESTAPVVSMGRVRSAKGWPRPQDLYFELAGNPQSTLLATSSGVMRPETR